MYTNVYYQCVQLCWGGCGGCYAPPLGEGGGLCSLTFLGTFKGVVSVVVFVMVTLFVPPVFKQWRCLLLGQISMSDSLLMHS